MAAKCSHLCNKRYLIEDVSFLDREYRKEVVVVISFFPESLLDFFKDAIQEVAIIVSQFILCSGFLCGSVFQFFFDLQNKNELIKSNYFY